MMKALYSTRAGRLLIQLALRAGAPRLLARYLRTRASRWLIPRYIKRHGVSMEGFPPEDYGSFADFFARRRDEPVGGAEPGQLVSPCDGWLSEYPIREDSSFAIKGSRYRLDDLVSDAALAREFCGGLCLIFRLTAADYHHYAFIDDGYIHESHFIEGKLHSVQPVACDAFPVYRLNRRCWNLLDTEHFGPVVQVEVGALAVGGIVNERERAAFRRGEEMGHFELCGSTIVLLIGKDQVELLPELRACASGGAELRVRQGMWIGTGGAADMA